MKVIRRQPDGTDEVVYSSLGNMSALDWLIGCRFESLANREFDWVVSFCGGVAIIVNCLWRILDNGRIRRTSADHGRQFGLPAPVDCVSEGNSLLAGAIVAAVELHEGTLDLRIRFNSEVAFELLPDSSGYEAWQVSRANQDVIAVGGGELHVVDYGRAGS